MRIQIDAVLPVNPDAVLAGKLPLLEAALEATLKGSIASDIKKRFRDRVRGWTEKPVFIATYNRNFKGGVSLLVRPARSKKWEWVSGGVPGRIITPRRAPMLVFQSEYRARTLPGNVYGRRSSRSGEVIRTSAVNWPGIAARDFEKYIAKESEGPAIAELSRAIRRVFA